MGFRETYFGRAASSPGEAASSRRAAAADLSERVSVLEGDKDREARLTLVMKNLNKLSEKLIAQAMDPKKMTVEQVKELFEALPDGPSKKDDEETGAVRAVRTRGTERAALRQAFGHFDDRPNVPHFERNHLVLPVTLSREDALAIVARDGRGSERLKATRGPRRLDVKAHRELLERFGRSDKPARPHWNRSSLVMPIMTKQEANALLAEREEPSGRRLELGDIVTIVARAEGRR
jgi:hypothetical protein